MIEELVTNYGTMFVPDTDSGQFWWLKNTGASPEDNFIEFVCELLDERPKGVAVDVGANFGCWTLPLSKHAHSVYAIEPQSACVNLMRQSLEKSGISNVHIVMAAAGAVPGTANVPDVNLDVGTNFGGVSLLQKIAEQPDAQLHCVPVVRLDDILRGAQVSFIKIDVEGFEQRVLLGAKSTIERCKPMLFVEMDHQLTNKVLLRETIEGMGYATEQLHGNYFGMPT